MKSGKRMARRLAAEAYQKLGFDIELLDVRRVCEYTNYFLFVSGKNRIHVDALKERMIELASEQSTTMYGLDGASDSGWIVIDFGDLIVHLFQPEVRRYYDLMSIWGDGKPVELDLAPAAPTPPRRAGGKK